MGILDGLFGSKDDPAPKEVDLGFPLRTFVMHGRQALAFRESWIGKPGVTPVIMGALDSVGLMKELLDMESEGESAEALIARASQLDLDAWFRKRREGEEEYFSPPEGEWSEEGGMSSLSVHLEVLSKQPHKEVVVGLFPTDNAWEVPAHVRYGNWNEVPEPAVHVALHKRWHDRFGATLACMSSDIIECTVTRPPQGREEAMALATEQFLYCPDIVHQGVETLEALASTIAGSRTWYFWWD